MISFVFICIVLINSRGVAADEGEKEKDPCNNACQGGEVCSFSERENQYQCICIGYDCGPDPCYQNPCKNGGTCEKSDNSYHCLCVESFFGKNCTDVLYSCDKVCENGGKCVKNGDKMECECTELYSGNSCETYDIELEISMTTDNNLTTVGSSTSSNFCYESPCKNGGTCELKRGGYKCKCSPRYSGKNCEKEPTTITTSSTTNEPTTITTSSRTRNEPTTISTTSNTTNEPTTITTTSSTTNDPTNITTTSRTTNEPTNITTTSSTTNDILDFCYESPCKNGGICELKEDGYKCKCSPRYSGENCEKEPPTIITTSSTRNEPTTITPTSRTRNEPTSITTSSSTTNESESPTTSVDTTIDFKSTTTSEVITVNHDLCTSSPCLNNGSCISIDNSVRCNCTYPFSGKLCDTDLSEKNPSSSNSIVYACTGSVGAIVFVFLIGFSVLWHLKRVKRRKKESYFHNADLSSIESENSRTYII